ncbi:hypothetical protein GECvBMG_gp017 [Salmonella phage GEC_vB_MG]|nr:hypothetical protein GECvBMG_gp017 [Salmonella phage GEC_vB_MG]
MWNLPTYLPPHNHGLSLPMSRRSVYFVLVKEGQHKLIHFQDVEVRVETWCGETTSQFFLERFYKCLHKIMQMGRRL